MTGKLPYGVRTAALPADRVTAVAAVVPVHDEAARLGRCLDAVARAVTTARATGLEATVVVVLDDCTDASAAVCAGRPEVLVVHGAWRRVGAARAAGCAAALGRAAAVGRPPAAVWLASTDADSTVPFDWLTHHVRLADAGADAVRGTVRVDDWSGWAPSVTAAYLGAYRHDPHHPHVHGANLGVRGSAYLDAGGFPAQRSHEDVALVRALEERGARVTATAQAAVRTSARARGRASDGFARHLRDLAGPVGAEGA